MIYMTWNDLARLRALHEDIEHEVNALKNLHGRHGMPKIVLPAIQEDLEHKRALYAEERARVEQYINECDDERTRSILADYFLEHLPWYKVDWRAGPGVHAGDVARNYVHFHSQLSMNKRERKMTYDG